MTQPRIIVSIIRQGWVDRMYIHDKHREKENRVTIPSDVQTRDRASLHTDHRLHLQVRFLFDADVW